MVRLPHMCMCVAWCATGLFSGSAWAQDGAEVRRYASLSLERKVGDGPLCFTAQSLRDHVNAQLGYDAFAGRAREEMLLLAVEVTRSEDEQWQATLTTSRQGEEARERTLSSPQCGDLLDAVVFSISLVIDPVQASSGTSPSSSEHASRLVLAARSRASKATLLAHTSAIVELARVGAATAPMLPVMSAMPSQRQTEDVTSSSTQDLAATHVGGSKRHSEPTRTAARDVRLGAHGRTGALPTRDFVLQGALRRVQGIAALEVSVESSIPNIYPSYGHEVTLSTHALEGGACVQPSVSQGHYLGLCAQTKVGMFRGRGRGFDTSRTARGVLFAPGASLRLGMNLTPTERALVEVAFGWHRNLAAVRWIVQDEPVSQSEPHMFSVGMSFVWRTRFE